jgi:hypothetical protein
LILRHTPRHQLAAQFRLSSRAECPALSPLREAPGHAAEGSLFDFAAAPTDAQGRSKHGPGGSTGLQAREKWHNEVRALALAPPADAAPTTRLWFYVAHPSKGEAFRPRLAPLPCAVIPSGVSRAFVFARSAGTRSRGISLGCNSRPRLAQHLAVFFVGARYIVPGADTWLRVRHPPRFSCSAGIQPAF